MTYSIEDLEDGSKRVMQNVSVIGKAPTVAELQAKLALHQQKVDELTAEIADLTPFEDTVVAHNSSL